MKWTRENPTAEGWHWYHSDFSDNAIIVFVIIRSKFIRFERSGFSGSFSVSKESTGKWYGPIELPEE